MSHLQERQAASLWVQQKLRSHKRAKVTLSGWRLKAFRRTHRNDVEAMKADIMRQVGGFLGAKVVVDADMRNGKLVALMIYRAKDTTVPA